MNQTTEQQQPTDRQSYLHPDPDPNPNPNPDPTPNPDPILILTVSLIHQYTALTSKVASVLNIIMR